jgi:hypothetical protein
MAAQLTVEYDPVGDILTLGSVAPYAEQLSDELDYGVVVRRNPESKAIENLEILFFTRRAADGHRFEVPVWAEFRAQPVR